MKRLVVLLCLLLAATDVAGAAEPSRKTERRGKSERLVADTPKNRKRASELVERALGAVGGLEAFHAIKDFRLTGKEVKAQSPKAPWDLEILWRAPEFWRDAVSRSEPIELEVAYGWNGKLGWAAGFGQIQDDPSVGMRPAAFNRLRLDWVADRARAGEITLLYWGEKKEDGKKWRVIEARLKGERDPVYYLFEDSSGQLGKVRYQSGRLLDGSREVTTIELSDYRKVGEVLWPHRLREVRKSKWVESVILDRRIDSVAFNVGLEEARFARPPSTPPIKMPPAEARDPSTGAPVFSEPPRTAPSPSPPSAPPAP